MDGRWRTEGKKRDRSANFTHEETEKLVSLIEPRIKCIESKQNGAIAWQDKERAWKSIETQYNSCCKGTFREAKHLKSKYESLKRDIRKKTSAGRTEMSATGATAASNPAHTLTPLEKKVKEIMLLAIESNDSKYDSDQVNSSGHSKHESIEAESELPLDNFGLSYEFDELSELSTNESSTKRKCLEKERECGGPSTSRNAGVKTWYESCFSDSTNEVSTQDPLTHSKDVDKDRDLDMLGATQPPGLEQIAAVNVDDFTLSSNNTRRPYGSLSRPKELRPFEKLAHDKIRVVALQKSILEEEMKHKLLQRRMLEEELEHKVIQKQILQEELEHKILQNRTVEEDFKHKKHLHDAEKEQMLLKTQILKVELENTKRKCLYSSSL